MSPYNTRIKKNLRRDPLVGCTMGATHLWQVRKTLRIIQVGVMLRLWRRRIVLRLLVMDWQLRARRVLVMLDRRSNGGRLGRVRR